MARKPDDEERLYLWVRAVGAIILLITVSFTAAALVILPVIVDDYRADSGALVVITGTLATSALALVGIELRLRRNGNGK